MINYISHPTFNVKYTALNLFLIFASSSVYGQFSRNNTTQVQGNIEINAQSENINAIATGTNSVAKNRIGIVEGKHKGNTNISVNTKNVTTVSSGRDRKACTTIGGVTNEDCK